MLEEARTSGAESEEEEESGDKWRHFMPKTNVIWLSHLLWELLERGVEVKEAASTEDAEVQSGIWSKLRVVLGEIDVEDLDKMPERAEELLEMGMQKDWVARTDVTAFLQKLNSENE